jgi:hypothetical protein
MPKDVKVFISSTCKDLKRAPDWRCVVIINVSTSFAGANVYLPVLAFHPGEPLLATCVDRADEISVLEIDEEALINSSSDINS